MSIQCIIIKAMLLDVIKVVCSSRRIMIYQFKERNETSSTNMKYNLTFHFYALEIKNPMLRIICVIKQNLNKIYYRLSLVLICKMQRLLF